jgi:hypothetical protein
MPNYCNNTLKITCSTPEIMFEIMEMIFAPDEKGEPVYTMRKLLPVPEEFSSSSGNSKIGYHWRCTNWGTKWDVIEPIHKLEEFTLILYYNTAWGPNKSWVKALCKIIYNMLYFEKYNFPNLSVEHNYWEWGMNFGGNLSWTLEPEFEYSEYYLEKYAYLYDKKLYNWLIDDMGGEPYNPEWEKFNKQLERITKGQDSDSWALKNKIKCNSNK